MSLPLFRPSDLEIHVSWQQQQQQQAASADDRKTPEKAQEQEEKSVIVGIYVTKYMANDNDAHPYNTTYTETNNNRMDLH